MKLWYLPLLGLAACGAVDPVTLARLAATSPLEADPAGFRIVAHLPDGLTLPEGGTHLTLSATRSGDVAEGVFTLARRAEAQSYAFEVAEADLPALRALQAKIRRWEAEDPAGTSGSLGIDVTACTTGAGPAPDARFSVDLAMEPGGAARPLLRPVAVSRYEEMLREEGGVGLMPCVASP